MVRREAVWSEGKQCGRKGSSVVRREAVWSEGKQCGRKGGSVVKWLEVLTCNL